MADFLTTYSRFIQPNEGYFANLQGDKGGITYGGIAYNIHPEWNGWPIVFNYIASKGGVQNVKNNERIKAADSAVIDFFQNWWNRLNLSALKSQDVANIFFDWIVNSGERTPTKTVQQIVGVSADGSLGPITLEAMNKMNAAKLNNAIKDAREQFYLSLGQPGFVAGWLARLDKFPTITIAAGVGGIVLLLIVVTILIVKS